ncbi:hypothetical protein K3495_g13064 [Podosphaera aphanis]|nr:hypothetical protein K3495_g13064 [Podosphaera aphanis]
MADKKTTEPSSSKVKPSKASKAFKVVISDPKKKYKPMEPVIIAGSNVGIRSGDDIIDPFAHLDKDPKASQKDQRRG